MKIGLHVGDMPTSTGSSIISEVDTTTEMGIPLEVPRLSDDARTQYMALYHECKTCSSDEDGRTHLSYLRVAELRLTQPVLQDLTRRGLIKWGMNGGDVDVQIVKR